MHRREVYGGHDLSIHFCLGWTFHLTLKDSGTEGSWIWYKGSYLTFSMPLNHPVFKFSLHQFSALTPKVDAFSCISPFDTLCIFNQLAVTAENKERPWEMVLFFGSLLFLWRKLQCLFFLRVSPMSAQLTHYWPGYFFYKPMPVTTDVSFDGSKIHSLTLLTFCGLQHSVWHLTF